MKLERTRNAARNVVFDGTMEIVNMLFPFVIRSVMLQYLGTEYLGLNGLFKSILSFLNLAELGVGSAMVFSMYRPIAEDDGATITIVREFESGGSSILEHTISFLIDKMNKAEKESVNKDIDTEM